MKYSTGAIGGAVALCIGLVGCGGGGGGGDGGGGASAAAQATMNPATPLYSLSVAVNGAAATADASGQYPIKSGDTVKITPSQASEWSSSGSATGAVRLLVQSITGASWSSALVNGTSSESLYTVTGKVGADSTRTQTVTFKVAAAATAGTPSALVLSPTYAVSGASISSISPASLIAQVAVGAAMPNVTFTGLASGDLNQLSGATLYIYVVDPAGLFQPNPRVTQFAGANPGVQVTLAGQQLKTAGTFTGTLHIYACLDSTCSRRLGNVPYPIPYTVVVK